MTSPPRSGIGVGAKPSMMRCAASIFLTESRLYARLLSMGHHQSAAQTWAEDLFRRKNQLFTAMPYTRTAVTAKRIKAIRQRLGESTQTFAQRFARSRRTVEDWEQGRRRPDKFVLQALLALGEQIGR